MNLSTNSMAGIGLGAWRGNGQPLTIISTRHHRKAKSDSARKTERNTRSDDSNEG